MVPAEDEILNTRGYKVKNTNRKPVRGNSTAKISKKKGLYLKIQSITDPFGKLFIELLGEIDCIFRGVRILTCKLRTHR